MRLSRRKFIYSFFISSLSIACQSRKSTEVSLYEFISERTRDKLDYLKYDSTVIEKYYEEYKVFHPNEFRNMKMLYSHNKNKIKGSYLENRFVSRFLMSTDFFRTNNKNKVKYYSYYYPEMKPCINPFANLS